MTADLSVVVSDGQPHLVGGHLREPGARVQGPLNGHRLRRRGNPIVSHRQRRIGIPVSVAGEFLLQDLEPDRIGEYGDARNESNGKSDAENR